MSALQQLMHQTVNYVDIDNLQRNELGGEDEDVPVPSLLPFDMISKPFIDRIKDVWIINTPIDVRISKYEETPGEILNPHLYIINISHGPFNWTVERRYKHFQALHSSLSIESAKRKFKEVYRSGIRRFDLPHLPVFLDSLLKESQTPKIMKDLEYYLQSLLNINSIKNHEDLLKFVEVSFLSFDKDTGIKSKEGICKKRPGGYYGLKVPNLFKRIFLRWKKKWFVVKDSYIAYVNPKSKSIDAVLLIDSYFQVRIENTRKNQANRIMIQNNSRKLLMKTWNYRSAMNWLTSIKDTSAFACPEFLNIQRFNSFSPIRHNSYGYWFVDGSGYFSSLADALYNAREQIFICDWWLSPMLYLKRPIASDGDKWRLDNILKFKAEEGVKIYILLYKEIQMALGLNSFYSKQVLTKLHPYNIMVMRHPDHISSNVYMWAHHEKICVIDQGTAFLGGLDVCYARWDNYFHRLTDIGVEDVTEMIEPQFTEDKRNRILLDVEKNFTEEKDYQS